MNRRNVPYLVFGAIGIVALGLYIIACGPSWSPDGNSIVFPFARKADLTRQGIALYDLRSKRVSSIFELTSEGREDAYLSARWARDGRSVIAFVGRSSPNELQVLRLPRDASLPIRVANLPLTDDGVAAAFYPVELAGRIYMGGDVLRRLDLATGEITTGPAGQVDKDHTVTLLSQGDHILYLRDAGTVSDSAPATSGRTPSGKPAPPDSGSSGTELGELDPGTLVLHRTCTIREADIERAGMIDEGSVSFSAGPGEGQATLVCTKVGKTLVLVFGREGIRMAREPKLDAESSLGPIAWARHGTVAYAPVLASTADSTGLRLSVAEMSADLAVVRLVPITGVAERSPDDLMPECQLAISPDERTLAISTAMSQKERTRRALFLVDLRDPQRRVTAIECPAPPADGAAGRR